MKHTLRSLTALLCAVCLTMALCGCSGTEPEDRTVFTPTDSTEILSGVETEAPAETLQAFSLSYFPSYGFNPYRCASLTNRTAFSLLYEGLFTVTGGFEAEPVLCDTFSVSEDQMTYRFTLVEGVTFSDGSALEASDVVASIQAAQNSGYYAGHLAHLTSVRACDAATLEITLDTPFENLPLVLDIPVVSAETVDSDTPIGTGPYALVKNGEQMVLQRSKSEWQAKPPVVDIDTITLVAVETPNEIRDNFEFGTTHLVCTDPNAAASVGYHCNYEVWDCSTTIMQYIGFNRTAGPFTNDTLRAAVTYAVNRAQIVTEVMNGYAAAASLPCAPQSPFYDNALAADYAYAPEQFRTALASSGAGTTADNPALFLVCSSDPKRVTIAQQIAEDLQSCGLYVSVQALDYDSYVSALRAGNYHMYYGEVKLAANFDLSCFYSADSELCLGGIVNSSIENLCMEALKNSGSYSDLFTAVMDDASICPVLFKYYAVYMSRGTVEYLSPALDNVLHVNGSRTLADASTAYDDGSEEETAPDTP